MYKLGAVGLVRSAGRVRGTCFRFRYDNVVLTAAHVLAAVDIAETTIEFPHLDEVSSVLALSLHPKADLGIVWTELSAADSPTGGPSRDAFLAIRRVDSGEDFLTHGFADLSPEEFTATSPVNSWG